MTETDIRITKIETDEEGGINISFLLTDKLDGTVVTGQRTFASTTCFRDLADFKGELWAGPVVEAEVPCGSGNPQAFTLALLIVAVIAGTGASIWAEWAPASLGFILTVGTAAMLLGTGPALAVSGLSVMAFNFFVMAPHFRFEAPTPKELLLAAFYILLSLYVPWLQRHKW